MESELTTRCALRERYGGPDRVRITSRTIPMPVGDQILVRVESSPVSQGDVHLLTGRPWLMRLFGYGIFRPKEPVLGVDFAGRVRAVGEEVRSLKVGDRVFGQLKGGAYSELVLAREDEVATVPEDVPLDEAAALPASGTAALQSLCDVGKLQPGQRLLVVGASGGVGSLAVSIGKILGAQVTGVCSHRNLDFVSSLGADEVIDYQSEAWWEGARRFDLILDTVCDRSVGCSRAALNERGTLVRIAGLKGNLVRPILGMLKLAVIGVLSRRQKIVFHIAEPKAEDLSELARLASREGLRPRIEQRWTLDEAPQALEAQSRGHRRGKSLIMLGE